MSFFEKHKYTTKAALEQIAAKQQEEITKLNADVRHYLGIASECNLRAQKREEKLIEFEGRLREALDTSNRWQAIALNLKDALDRAILPAGEE